MSARPRFTVVVPALDEGAYLPRTLSSLRAQDFAGEVEVVVVDNGSTDDTAAVALAMGARVEREPVRGVCAARQRGTVAARGEIVVSTDADTVHPVHWLSRIDAQFRAEPGLVAVAGPCRYEEPPWWAAVLPRVGFGVVSALHRHTGWVGYLTATNVAFRKDGFPGYDVTLTQGGDEVDLLRRLRRRGRVLWDPDNAVTTSSRRIQAGLAHTVLVSYGYYYAGAYVLGRTTGRRLVDVAPLIREGDAPLVRQQRRRWRVAGVATAVLVTAARTRPHVGPDRRVTTPGRPSPASGRQHPARRTG